MYWIGKCYCVRRYAPIHICRNSIPIQTNSTATGLCALTYTVTVSDGIGNISDTVTIPSLSPPTAPQICLLTVDSLSQNNIIIWDKTPFAGGRVDSFIVHREVSSNIYKQIGAVPFASLSIFTDTVRKKYFIPLILVQASERRYVPV